MRTRLMVMVGMLAIMGFAQNESEEPKALTVARERYQQEVKQVTKPVNQKYLDILDKLKKELGTSGDAVGAMAVQTEIDGLKESVETSRKHAVEGRWQFTMYGKTYYREYKDGVQQGFSDSTFKNLTANHSYKVINATTVLVDNGEKCKVHGDVLDLGGNAKATRIKGTK